MKASAECSHATLSSSGTSSPSATNASESGLGIDKNVATQWWVGRRLRLVEISMSTHAIHHVTAVTAQIGKNMEFYTGILGLRLVKRSVNQDDVSAYHLFYADAVGSPGTDM